MQVALVFFSLLLRFVRLGFAISARRIGFGVLLGNVQRLGLGCDC